jgi:hypothetical protein
MCNRYAVATACWLAFILGQPAQAQGPKEVKVSAATRLDWKFAAAGFGPDATKGPQDYDSTKQRYQLFVPKKYAKDKAWPLVAFISPGDQPAGWGAWQKACEARGMLFCSPFKAGNNVPAGQRTRIVLDMLDDVRRQYTIDPNQTYLAGLSGGGRMACSIGFALPEYFGGIIPVCGTNPLPTLAYLRHRIHDRLSVAFVTGTTDFNRKENEEYMAPYFKELGIRSKLWMPAVGHTLPPAGVVEEVHGWLAEDLKRRAKNAEDYPGLNVAADTAPTAKEQASGMLTTALADLKQPERVWRGVTLLQGVVARWGSMETGKEARSQLMKVSKDEGLLQRVSEQGADDEVRFLTAQAKAFERFGLTNKAIDAWELLARNYADTAIGHKAAAEVKRLRK